MHRASLVGISVLFFSAIFIFFVYTGSENPKPLPTVTTKTTSRTVKRDFAFVTIVNADEYDQLRALAGSIHYWHSGVPLVVYARNFTRTDLQEARAWIHTEVLEITDLISDDTLSDEDRLPIAIHDAAEIYGNVIYINPKFHIRKPINDIYYTLSSLGVVCLGDTDTADCCGTDLIGFTHDGAAYKTALIPAATCSVMDTCRGSVVKQLRFGMRKVANATEACLSQLDSDMGALAVTSFPRDTYYTEHISTRKPHSEHHQHEHNVHPPPPPPPKKQPEPEHEHNVQLPPPPPPPPKKQEGEVKAEPETPKKQPEPEVPTKQPEPEVPKAPRICFLIPSTTKNAQGVMVDKGVDDLPLFNILLSTLVPSIRNDFRVHHYTFDMFLGIDIGDPIYDNHELMHEVRQRFVETTQEFHMHLFVKKFDSSNRGAPAWFWNGLYDEAVESGCDYSYQLNDDILMLSNDWASEFISKLANNPIYPGLGAVGPADEGNHNTMTQSMVHKTHREIFGFYYPRSLKNWYSDDWITHVYDDYQSSFWLKHHKIRNKNEKGTRYSECNTCGGVYQQELAAGKRVLQEWVNKNRQN